MEPADFSSSSSDYGSGSENQAKKRDFFDMAFDPWAVAAGSSNLFKSNSSEEDKAKKPRLFDKEPFFGIGLGLGPDMNDKEKSVDEDEQDGMDDKEIPPDEPTSTSNNRNESETELDTSEVLPPSTTGTSVENKLVDDADDDPEQEASSPTTTPPQSSSEPEPTPRSSNEGDGDKSDKAESESSKSMQVSGGTSNGCIINYISPSITKRSVTLEMLLAGGILKPGEGTMSLEYHGQKFVGDLLENGQIRSQETSQIFSSPSAWATTCKQIINPDKSLKKSGCGWASIKYKSLKLDYYKAVWFKRLREGSIDIRNISNGAVSSSSDTDEDDRPHCILKFGEHFDNNPRNQSAQQIGAKILISCTEFKEMERLQPFHVKVSADALAFADFHCNITSSETVGYISGQWNGDQNTLKMEMIHPCRVLMPSSTAVECDNERNRIATEIQRIGHEVVGWYHSHPKAPPIPSKDDIGRQLDYQIMMKGASEASYIPCVGIIISPLCYSEQSDMHKSNVQFFWAMPPPENRPLEMGRPMHIDYETYPSTNFDPRKLLTNMNGLIDFYKGYKELVDLNELGIGKLERLKETVSTWLPALKLNDDFWFVIQQNMKSEVCLPKASSPPLIPSKINSSSTSTSSSPAAHIRMDEKEFEGQVETNNHHPPDDPGEESEQMES